ncbi:hypothetical protein AB4114_18295 [Paenibacillus sp. 2RAB27]
MRKHLQLRFTPNCAVSVGEDYIVVIFKFNQCIAFAPEAKRATISSFL